MPKCKNDPSRSYKGTEPSPKGLGYCAHGMKEGDKKKGKDGNIWIIKKIKNGSLRWIKFKEEKNNKGKKNNKKFDCSKFVWYTKKVKGFFGGETKYHLKGIKGEGRNLYKFISYNNFEKKLTPIPEDYRKKSIKKKLINDYICGNLKILGKDNEEYKIIKKKYSDYKRYYIHDNGGRPYLVYLGKKDAYIYKEPSYTKDDKYDDIDTEAFNRSIKDDDNKWAYIDFFKHIKFKKAFIGKSKKNKMTTYSGGYGKDFDGNSFLFQTGKDKYFYIGSEYFDFKTFDDKILKYYSPVGNSDVPYPYAIGEKNIYSFVHPYGYLPIKEFSNIKNQDILMDEMFNLDPFFILFNKKKSNFKLKLSDYRELKNKPLEDIKISTIKDIAKIFSVTYNGSKKQIANRIYKLRGVKIGCNNN